MQVFDAIDDLLEEAGIDAATGAIGTDRCTTVEVLSNQLEDAICRERYEEASRLMAEIRRMEREGAV